ncbi:hypothetical protein B7494_g1510 [Chlorociboria aeruginascens]|nr:hypothetical protein B7494_g1510 [Chlorociboria aeruginascens]
MPRGKALEERGKSNRQMTLSRQSPHPTSSKYDDSGPPAKRLCTLSTTKKEESSRSGSGDESVPRLRDEVPDSGDEQDSDDDKPRQTGLESALAPVRTDKDAIEDYESMQSDDRNLPENLRARLHQGSWTKGQTSIYVDAFNLALQTVLDDEGHLFDEKERQVFKTWEELQYEAQFLRYVRLFLRKTSAWHRINRLAYYSDIKDIPATSKVLQSIHQLPKSTAESQINPAELTRPEDTVLGKSFCFAEHSENIGLEEASSLLNLDELKWITKDAKIQGKNKSELLAALRRMSHYQTGLGWNRLKRTESMESMDSSSAKENINSKDEDLSKDMTMENYLLGKILAITGHSIRLSSPILRLFERVHLVFYRSTEWTESSLTTIILARISRRNFAEYIVSRSANIFPSRSQLLEFEAGLRTQFRVDTILEFNGHPGREGLNQVLGIFDEVYPRWQYLTREEQLKESVYKSGEGAYLRRFSPAWIYTRIIHKAASVLGRFKMYEREHEVMTELLDQRLFHAARRGAWYQRKALLEEHYMSALQPPDGILDVQLQKRHWKRRALLTCEQGLQDKDCHTIYHHNLQKRIKKLEKSLKIPKREQHDFGHILLGDPMEVHVEGIQIKKGIFDSKAKFLHKVFTEGNWK